MKPEHYSRYLVEQFYYKLDQLSNIYEELKDTDVREALHFTLNYFFVWDKRDREFPISYGMFSAKGDKAIAKVVKNFLLAAYNCSEVTSTPVGQLRLNILQNREIKTPSGYEYDEFIGHSDQPLPPEILPEFLFWEGDYD